MGKWIHTTPRMRLILLLSCLPALTNACAAGYNTVYDGLCFKNFGSGVHYDVAKNTCDSDDGHLPRLYSQAEQDQYWSVFHGYYAWTGLICDGERFIWDDGTVATYTNFDGTVTCNSGNTLNTYINPSYGKWYQSDGSQDTNNAVCAANTRSWICDTYYLLQMGKSDDWCYLFITSLTAQPAAESNCLTQRAHIAAIHDKDFNDYLKRTAVGYGITNGLLIGLKFVNGKYEWNDGSEVDYTNFAPGFPDESFGECVTMGINLKMDELGLCHSTSIHIFSPTWGSATGPALCDYALMDLDKTKKVTVEIVFFESNSCCDTLTIYDGLVGSTVLKTLSGYYGFTSIKVTASANAIRMEWNAKSGAHVRGWHAKVTSA
ncbi:hypothetical protein PRIPAC_83054 [Pristionchus pacificus]|uniref:C-type lectin n=1 Tax=Pristionchus pacificus TaxID=54126 RepID=A0A2A6BY82_PRIPA|nr:hypothetical protein PRIPAC_83054 [Pristionchus pacificus]|eukprot:PDM70865.1 C-type lectin [Pristionchus pacificus]